MFSSMPKRFLSASLADDRCAAAASAAFVTTMCSSRAGCLRTAGLAGRKLGSQRDGVHFRNGFMVSTHSTRRFVPSHLSFRWALRYLSHRMPTPSPHSVLRKLLSRRRTATTSSNCDTLTLGCSNPASTRALSLLLMYDRTLSASSHERHLLLRTQPAGARTERCDGDVPAGAEAAASRDGAYTASAVVR